MLAGVYKTVYLQPSAPPKPAATEPCNGCGVCCAVAPCPLGMLASGRTDGACAALLWVEGTGVYRCGLLARPEAHLPGAMRWFAPVLARVARRAVSAGSGCDCDYESEIEPGSRSEPEPAL